MVDAPPALYLTGVRKKKPYGDNLREQLLHSARDRLHLFLLDYGSVRGALVHSTRMVNEMRANHELGVLETLVLGHAYQAATLMTVNLKGADRLRINIQCQGPVQGLSVESNAFGEVRGYLAEVPIPVEGAVDQDTLAGLFGEGVLTVTRTLERARQPFSGAVRLEYGTLAEDLANYFLISEQVPSAMSLSVRFDPAGEVIGAGGLFLQAMPAAEKDTAARMEGIVRGLPSIGGAFAEGRDAEELLREHFADFSPLMLGSRRVAFMCHCSKHRFGRFMSALPEAELADMAENGPFPVVTTCFNCNTSYSFSREQIAQMHRSAAER